MKFRVVKYLLVAFPLLCLSVEVCHAQQATREQLLKLFYKAHTAQKANNQVAAIDAYKEILKLSPGLPDPYLQLGNLYAGMDDAASLQKACICYSKYIELKPESADAPALKTKITELTQKAADLEQEAVAEATPAKPTFEVILQPKDTATVVEEPEPQPDPQPQPEVATTDAIPQAVADSTLTVTTDTVPAIVPSVAVPFTSEALTGRWASAEMGDNGREMWIMDIATRADGKTWMRFNPHSYAKNNPLIAAMHDWEAPAYIDGDTLIFTFKIERKKEQKQEKKASGGLLDEFTSAVGQMFGGGAVGAQTDSNKEEASADKEIAPLPLPTDSLALDSLDSVRIVRNPIMVYTYEFRLKHEGKSLLGTLQNRTSERTFHEKILSDEQKVCELFLAPTDYTGFSYTPISEETKATRREFRELLNQKMQASATGDISALNDLGCMYASGLGTRKNIKMAMANLMEAAMKNSLFGMLNMAQFYLEGLGVERDVEKARELYQRAFDTGYTDAMVLCGDTYLGGSMDAEPDYDKALACYQKAIFRRCPYAYYRLGWLYHEGLGVEQDSIKAWDYYQRACTMQYPDAMTEVGMFYRDGIMTEKDYAKSVELLNKAVTKGNARAMYELSQMYLRGQGVEQDFKQSKEWLRKSMEADDRVIEGFNTMKSKIKNILHPQQ